MLTRAPRSAYQKIRDQAWNIWKRAQFAIKDEIAYYKSLQQLERYDSWTTEKAHNDNGQAKEVQGDSNAFEREGSRANSVVDVYEAASQSAELDAYAFPLPERDFVVGPPSFYTSSASSMYDVADIAIGAGYAAQERRRRNERASLSPSSPSSDRSTPKSTAPTITATSTSSDLQPPNFDAEVIAILIKHFEGRRSGWPRRVVQPRTGQFVKLAFEAMKDLPSTAGYVKFNEDDTCEELVERRLLLVWQKIRRTLSDESGR